MSSLKVIVSSEGYNGDFVGYSPVVTKGLSTWSFLKGGAKESARNYSDGENMTVFGAPSYTSSYAHTKSSTDYFKTDTIDTSEITIIGVARVPSPSEMDGALSTPVIGGNFDTRTSNLDRVGSQLLFRNLEPSGTAHIVFKRAGVGDVSTSAALRAADEGFDVEEFGFYAGVGFGDGSIAVRNPATNSEFSRSGPAPSLSSETITAGGERTLVTGQLDLAFFAVYNRALSGDEISQIYKQVKAYLLARHSINI